MHNEVPHLSNNCRRLQKKPSPSLAIGKNMIKIIKSQRMYFVMVVFLVVHLCSFMWCPCVCGISHWNHPLRNSVQLVSFRAFLLVWNSNCKCFFWSIHKGYEWTSIFKFLRTIRGDSVFTVWLKARFCASWIPSSSYKLNDV